MVADLARPGPLSDSFRATVSEDRSSCSIEHDETRGPPSSGWPMLGELFEKAFGTAGATGCPQEAADMPAHTWGGVCCGSGGLTEEPRGQVELGHQGQDKCKLDAPACRPEQMGAPMGVGSYERRDGVILWGELTSDNILGSITNRHGMVGSVGGPTKRRASERGVDIKAWLATLPGRDEDEIWSDAVMWEPARVPLDPTSDKIPPWES